MVKAIIAVSSLMLGGGLFGVIALLQSNRFAFTSAGMEPQALTTSIRALEPALVSEPEIPQVLTLPEVKITGPRFSGAKVAAPPLATVPCSEWIELGPTAVATKKTLPMRHVLLMCPPVK